MKSTSFLEWVYSEKEAFLNGCIFCGQCVKACSVFPYLLLEDKSPKLLQEQLINVLRGNPAAPQAYTKVFACSQCGSCLHSCPKGLNPFLMQAFLKSEMISQGLKPLKSANFLGTENLQYDFQDIVGGIQLKPSQRRWLHEIPSNPKQTDLVLFLGCSVRMMPDQILAALDIMQKLDIDSVALAGGSSCCGMKYLFNGDFNKADHASSQLLLGLESFRPKKVVFWCGTCYYHFKHLIPRFTTVPFVVQHFSQLLCDNLSKFEFGFPLHKTVTIHDSCNLGRKGGDFTSIRKLLSAIPGINIVEMSHNQEESLCCGGTAHYYHPQIAKQMRSRCLDEARGIQADILLSSCGGCNLFFAQDEDDCVFEARNYINVFAEALGIYHEDKLKRYLKFRNVDRVLEEARECIEVSPFSMEQTKRIVADFFNKGPGCC